MYPLFRFGSEKHTGVHIVINQSIEHEATYADIQLSEQGSYLETRSVRRMRRTVRVKDLFSCTCLSFSAVLSKHALGF